VLAVFFETQIQLTLSLPTPLRLYTVPYWSTPPFLFFDIQMLWRSGLSTRAPEFHKIKNGGLEQYRMALNSANSDNLEQLTLKGLSFSLVGFCVVLV